MVPILEIANNMNLSESFSSLKYFGFTKEREDKVLLNAKGKPKQKNNPNIKRVIGSFNTLRVVISELNSIK